jgi:hypothetical protein
MSRTRSHRTSLVLGALALALVVMLVNSTQAYAAVASIYNPMSLSNTTASTYAGHPVTFFVGWQNRFAEDLNSPDETPDGPIWMWGDAWSTAVVLSGSDAPKAWATYRWIGGVCTYVGQEYAMALALNLPNGQTAGFSVSHLSNYHYGPGATVQQGAQIANESWLSAAGSTYYGSTCDESTLTATAPHIHAESARTGSTTTNDIDPVSGPAYYPYWYYVY